MSRTQKQQIADREKREEHHAQCRTEGPVAGLKKLVALGKVQREERTVLILTGHTLKDSQYTIDYHRGELLTDAEKAQIGEADQARHTALRKPPIVLEADSNVVLHALESHMKMTQHV